MKEKNPIDELFKQGLANKEIKPSDTAWTKIEEAMVPEDSKKGGFYFMRAAVVTLLIGLSSWVYISNNPIDFSPKNPIPATTLESPSVSAVEEGNPKKGDKPNQGTKTTINKNTSPKKSPTKSVKKIVPILKTSGNTLGKYVSNEPSISPAEEDFWMMDEELIAFDDLITEDKDKLDRIKIRVPVTERSFYKDNAEQEDKQAPKKLKFKEKVFAYASDQFDNLIKGEPLELPKTEINGRPKLEISLGNFLRKE